MEEPGKIIPINDNQTNIQNTDIINSYTNEINSNTNSNSNSKNNEFDSIKKENVNENKILSNISTNNKSNDDYEIQIEFDKSKTNKKFVSNNNNYSNNYSKSPSYRNNKNINNHMNINKVVKPFFTSKHILLNKYSLKEVNECIYKDYNQLANILPYYQNYYFQNKINNNYNNYNYRNNNNNNNDAILICLKYIEYTNFFFNNDITYKVQNLLFNIINGDRRILEQNKYNYLKIKLNEVYNKLIPYHIRYNYLKAFYDRNPDKNLYYLFKKDLDKISMSKYIDKKNLNYLSEIFEIVKQKMEMKKDNIKAYISKLINNNMNNNLNNINNSKNGGNYNYIENLNNNINDLDLNINKNDYNSFNSRKHSYQYSTSQNDNIPNYKNINNNIKNNYMNGSIRKNNINNKEISQFNINNYNKDNNYKVNYSNRNYYYKNNNNDRDYLRNKNNRINSYYKGELVEIGDIQNTSSTYENKNDENNINNINNIDNKNIENNDNNDIDEEYKNLSSNKNKNNENDGGVENIKIPKIYDDYYNKVDQDEQIINNDNIYNINGKTDVININNKDLDNNINNNIQNKDQAYNESFNNVDNDIIINNNGKINGNENINSKENNNINVVKIDDDNSKILKENEKLISTNINTNEDINGKYDIINEDNIDNEEKNSNNDLNSFDFLYNTNNNNEKNNNIEINSDNIFPTITYNELNSEQNDNNSKNNIENHSNDLINNHINNNNNNQNNNKENNLININNIINNFNNYNHNININNGILSNNELIQFFKQILINQNNIMANIKKYVIQFNQLKPNNNINPQNLSNNYFLNIFNLGINNNLNYNSNLYNSKNNKNHNSNSNPFKRDKLVESEYIKIKKLEKEKPEQIKDNIYLFENNILLPIYNEINLNNNNSETKSLYTLIYLKYKEVILSILNKNNLKGTIVEPYGSIVNNFLTTNGDIDISIVPNNISKEEFIKYLKEIEEELVKEKKYSTENNNNIYINFRYALLSLTDIETNINIDITVHNLLPINNSKMIRLYSLFDQRFHILGLFLKHWVKINNIKGAPNGFLSSYALLILIIHFLQNVVEPKILPNLQAIKNEQIEYKYHYGEKELITNLYYEQDFNKVKEYMNIINCGNENNSSVTELLVQFFDYYAYRYNASNHYLISIKHDDKKLSSNYEQIAFPIEDPFDIVHNPGKSLKFNTQQYSEFIFCMKKEINNILSGEYFKYVNY